MYISQFHKEVIWLKQTIILFLFSLCMVLIAAAIGPEKAQSLEDEELEMIEARQKFFGEQNVNAQTGEIAKDKIIVSWFGVSNFAAAINGHVVLLDTWIPGGEDSNYVPTNPDELAQLKPEAVFIGHAHYDHTDYAVDIIEKTEAVLVGTPEHCEIIKKDAKNEDLINCIEAVGADAQPGEKQQLNFLDGVEITALTHVHSGLELPDREDVSSAIFPKKDRESEAPRGDFSKIIESIGEDEGGTLMYQFKVGDFTLTWNDSAGPIKEKAPELTQIMASLPKTDVQLGAIMGFNQYTNGLRDSRMYMEALQPTLFVPTHHDNWSPPITTTAKNYEEYLKEELKNIPSESRPDLLFIEDPKDYLNPGLLTFDINDPKWK